MFPRTQEESIWKTSFSDLDILSRSADIRNQSWTLQKSTEILHVLAPNIFREGPQIFGPYPVIALQSDSDHVAKFRDDRPMDLGDLAA